MLKMEFSLVLITNSGGAQDTTLLSFTAQTPSIPLLQHSPNLESDANAYLKHYSASYIYNFY